MGHPVLLVHGMWCTGADWDRVRALMQARGYRCHAPTLPAHEPTPDQPMDVARLSLRDYLAYLESYLRDLQLAQAPILIGHSMGGLLACQLAARTAPLALVLLTPAPPWGINALSGSNLAALSAWLTGGAFWRHPHKPDARRAARSYHNGVAPERLRTLYERMVYESGRAACEIGFWPLDFSRAAQVDVKAIRCPVYVVSCGQDKLTPAPVVRKVAALFPQASTRHFAERGHWVIDDEETDEMMHAICGWLRPLELRAARAQPAPR